MITSQNLELSKNPPKNRKNWDTDELAGHALTQPVLDKPADLTTEGERDKCH